MKTVGKKKKRQLLMKALDGDLDRISKSPWVRSLKDGKQYICTCCDLPVQPCKTNSSILCSHVLLEGTDGAILEKALKEFDPDTVGKCSICGNDIPLSYLRKHPNAEVCTKCQSKARKVHSVH